jgi:hypothetical protein
VNQIGRTNQAEDEDYAKEAEGETPYRRHPPPGRHCKERENRSEQWPRMRFPCSFQALANVQASLSMPCFDFIISTLIAVDAKLSSGFGQKVAHEPDPGIPEALVCML